MPNFDNHKRLIAFAAVVFVLALVPSSLFAGKAYENVYIKITRTWINQNQVRIIEGETMQQSGAGLRFLLSCTPKFTHCTAPVVSKVYGLHANSEFRYDDCDNYLLGSPTIEGGGIPVCLDNIEPTP